MTNSESPGIIEGPREPKSQIYIMPQIMLTASKTHSVEVLLADLNPEDW